MEERNHQVIFVVVVAFCCWQKANPWRRFSSKGQNTGGVLVLLCVLALLCFTWFWLLFVTIPFLAQSLVHSRPLFCCTPSLPWRCFSSNTVPFSGLERSAPRELCKNKQIWKIFPSSSLAGSPPTYPLTPPESPHLHPSPNG